MAHLRLDTRKIERCRALLSGFGAGREMIAGHTTVAIERATLRLLGVDGAIEQAGQWYPSANVIVEDLRRARVLDQGALHWFVNGMIQMRASAAELAEAVATRQVDLLKLERAQDAEIQAKARELCVAAVHGLVEARERRDRVRAETGDPFDATGKNGPLLYVIVATGNIYEDAVQARAARSGRSRRHRGDS